jgi:hypothetical protein
MNIIGNNVKQPESGTENTKTKGLLFNDFCAADNLLVVIHGRIITCFDVSDKIR